MTKSNLLSRAAATAAVALGPCLAALVCPALAQATSTGAGKARAAHKAARAAHRAHEAAPHYSSESLPLNLGASSSATHVSSGGASLVRTIVGLAIVIAVIWGLSWVLRQVKAGRDPQLPSAGLASVAALTLSSGRSVHLVRAGSEYVLLGSAEQGLVPIHRYTEQEARDAGLLLEAEPPPARRRQPLLAPRAESSESSDPMRMATPGTALVERLREWTVRR